MTFDYLTSLTGTPQPLTPDDWASLLDSPQVAEICAKVEAGEKELKRKLPAIMWQATYNGKPRKNENAQSSGLYMLDIDHVEDPDELSVNIQARMNMHPQGYGIVIMHITPSGKGLRIVARMLKEQGFERISQYQKWLADELKLEDYDAVTKDLARMSFAVPRKNLLYYDPAVFVLEAEATVKNLPPEEKPLFNDLPQQETASTEKPAQTTYQGHPLSEIWVKLVEMVIKKPIEEGDRNSSIYRTALLFRYVCDNNPNVIVANIPTYGLSKAEVFQAVRSACNYELSQRSMAYMMKLYGEMYSPTAADGTATGIEASRAELISMPKLDFELPPLFSHYVNLCPDDYKIPMLLSMLPVLGTIATGIRAPYLDGVMQSPSFFSVLVAPQASGKSFLRPMVAQLTERIRMDDLTARALETAYKDELRKCKNKAKQPEDPHAAVRIVPASISIAQLLKRLDHADGKHLFTFCEEIDTLTKSNKSGSWSQKSDIYRNAFDNAEYGQDYISENTYSAIVKVFYNMLVLGTPKAVQRFFGDPEDGLCSRVCFITLPDQFGAEMPVFGSLSAKQLKTVQSIVARLMQNERVYKLNYLTGEIQKWLSEKRKVALESQSNAINIFMRRAAVIGFRAALICHAIYGSPQKKHQETIAHMFRFVSDACLYTLFARYGEKMEDAEPANGETKQANIYNMLPAEFTLDELARVAESAHAKTQPKKIALRLRKAGLLEQVRRGVYRKVEKPANDKQK